MIMEKIYLKNKAQGGNFPDPLLFFLLQVLFSETHAQIQLIWREKILPEEFLPG